MTEIDSFDDLLRRYRRAGGALAQELREELIRRFYAYLLEGGSLKSSLDKRFRGVGVTEQANSAQYTALVNQFFTHLMHRHPEEFLEGETLAELRALASAALANLVYDALRRRRRGEDVQHALLQYAQMRREHFEDQRSLSFEDVLRLIREGGPWDTREAPFPLWAAVLRYRYVDGMPYPEITSQLEAGRLGRFEVGELYRIRDKAVQQLRKQLIG